MHRIRVQRPNQAPWLIRLSIETTEPLIGTAATDGHAPRAFEGWLELLTVISELTGHPGT
jgi:hypothetical protein